VKQASPAAHRQSAEKRKYGESARSFKKNMSQGRDPGNSWYDGLSRGDSLPANKTFFRKGPVKQASPADHRQSAEKRKYGESARSFKKTIEK
jgi:hypothetical protein